jgi:hypothetical protein
MMKAELIQLHLRQRSRDCQNLPRRRVGAGVFRLRLKIYKQSV